MSNNRYVYTIVRTDIPRGLQFAQLGHSCLIAGTKFKGVDKTNIVCLGVKSEADLFKLADRLEKHSIKYCLFYEPDISSYTSICTETIKEDKRKIFRKYELLS